MEQNVDYTGNTRDDNAASDLRNTNNDYSAYTRGNGVGATGADIQANLPSIGKLPIYQTASTIYNLGRDTYYSALRLTYENIGVARQVLQRRIGTAGAQGIPVNPVINEYGNNDYKVSPIQESRIDTQYDYVFRIGEYFAPINIKYTLKAEKNISASQLVDGPEIIEFVNRKPKIIDIEFQIRPNLSNDPTISRSESLASFVEGTVGLNGDEDVFEYELISLRAVLNALWLDNEVFTIEHAALNNIYDVRWVFMEDFEVRPNRGNVLVDFRMRLREVNMDENAIVFGNTYVDNSSTAGGGTSGFRQEEEDAGDIL